MRSFMPLKTVVETNGVLKRPDPGQRLHLSSRHRRANKFKNAFAGAGRPSELSLAKALLSCLVVVNHQLVTEY